MSKLVRDRIPEIIEKSGKTPIQQTNCIRRGEIMNTTIPEELKKKIYCRISITCGWEIDCEDEQLWLNGIRDLGLKYNLDTTVEKENRYCCSNYNVVRIRGYLTFENAEKFAADYKKDHKSSLFLEYDIEEGFFISWDNTYC